MCQRSSNHKLKAIHNYLSQLKLTRTGVSKIVKSQIESNSQLPMWCIFYNKWCVKDRQITNWKQFTTLSNDVWRYSKVCQRSSNHKLKAIHNIINHYRIFSRGVSKIVKSQIESNSQHWRISIKLSIRCVKDRQITNWKQFTTMIWFGRLFNVVCQRSSNHKLKAIHNAMW